jgi:hypothetical protein
MERSVAAFAGSANGGMVVTASALAQAHRERNIKLAAQHRLPAIYFERHFVTAGSLISYGGNTERLALGDTVRQCRAFALARPAKRHHRNMPMRRPGRREVRPGRDNEEGRGGAPRTSMGVRHRRVPACAP